MNKTSFILKVAKSLFHKLLQFGLCWSAAFQNSKSWQPRPVGAAEVKQPRSTRASGSLYSAAPGNKEHDSRSETEIETLKVAEAKAAFPPCFSMKLSVAA